MILLGWIGQILYFSRSSLQWLHSERAGRSLVPNGYWELSLLGTVCLGSYALLGHDPVILLGQVVNAAIYLRNLHLQHRPSALTLQRRVMILIAITLLIIVFFLGHEQFTQVSTGWTLAGWLGQTLFLCRFPIQWWHAERSGRNELPALFWHASFLGSGLILGYALSRLDWVIISGQAVGLLMYSRNLYLIHSRVEEAGLA